MLRAGVLRLPCRQQLALSLTRARSVTTLFLGNVDYTATEEDVAEALAQFNVDVSDVRLAYDWKRNRMLGHAFVSVDDEGAEVLLRKGKVVLSGRECFVEMPRSQQQHG